MKHKPFSMKGMDNAISHKILEDYPADWNMDRVFDESYQKYLGLKNTENQKLCGDTENVDAVVHIHAEETPKKSRIQIFSFNKFTAAACMAIVLMLTKFLCTPPAQVDHIPDISGTSPPSSNEQQQAESYEVQTDTANAAGETNISSGVTASENIPAATEENHANGNLPEPTEAAVPPASFETAPAETQPAVHTDIPVQPVTADNTEGEAEPPAPIETADAPLDPVATDPSQYEPPAYGHFQFNKGAYTDSTDAQGNNFDQLVYVRTLDTPVEQKEHTVSLAGFTVTSTVQKEDGSTVIKINEDENGQFYYLYIYSYETFSMGFNPNVNHIISYFDINNRPACSSRTSDETHSLCLLMWDDGCHICILNSTLESYDKMVYIAENLS